MTRALVVAVVTIAAALSPSRDARAELEPSRAAEDTRHALASGGDAFCRNPPTPLTKRAARLCAHASALPDCAAFVKACAEARASGGAAGGGSSSSRPAQPKPEREKTEVPAAVGAIARMILWIVVGVVVAVIVGALVRAFMAWRKNRKVADRVVDEVPDEKEETKEPPPVVVSDAEALLARAAAFERAGKLDLALHAYLGAGLSALDRRGAIRVSKDRTNGEYVRTCGEQPARAPLRDLVNVVDRVQFGGERATSDGVSRASRAAVALVRSARAMATMMLALLLVLALPACGGGTHGGGGGASVQMHGDPAGDDIFTDVMKRQGVLVAPLAGSLATLPMPTDDDMDVPVVLVDAERTHLDDETRAHLARWAFAGGVLVLAGAPSTWPSELETHTAYATGEDVTVAWRTDPKQKSAGLACKVAIPDAFTWPEAHTTPLAWFAGGETYAAIRSHGRGQVLGLATGELLANAALARPGNAAALVAIVHAASPRVIHVARPEDGIAPPANPVSSMSRAGLGPWLVHSLVAVLVLFVAVGARLARPKPTPPPPRRAFAEHVEASGALYAKTRLASHALAVYARHVDSRVRARMPRGTSDVPMFLAQRSGADLASCQELWLRAQSTHAASPPRGDELDLLKRLTRLYAAAMADAASSSPRAAPAPTTRASLRPPPSSTTAPPPPSPGASRSS